MKSRLSEKQFIAAYDEHAEAIFRFCAFQLRDRERARDIMQDAFTRTWTYLESGKEIENLRAFLYKTARNLCINEAVRSKAYSLEEMQAFVGFDPEDAHALSPERLAEHALVLRHLDELDPSAREALTLRYLDGLAVNEIGEILGQAPNTVSVRIHRAVAELRKRMHITHHD